MEIVNNVIVFQWKNFPNLRASKLFVNTKLFKSYALRIETRSKLRVG